MCRTYTRWTTLVSGKPLKDKFRYGAYSEVMICTQRCVKTRKIRPKSDFLAPIENSASTKSMGYNRADSRNSTQHCDTQHGHCYLDHSFHWLRLQGPTLITVKAFRVSFFIGLFLLSMQRVRWRVQSALCRIALHLIRGSYSAGLSNTEPERSNSSTAPSDRMKIRWLKRT